MSRDPLDLDHIFAYHAPTKDQLGHYVAVAELKRVRMERMGAERYLKESGAAKIQEDEYGILWGKPQFNAEALLMVEVINATPEPDGSFKHYWLRVPPTTLTAHQGVAWSFGFDDPGDYHPHMQT